MELLNTFLSYLLLMIIIVALCGVSVTIGILLRKRKNAAVQTVEAVENVE